MMFYAKPINRPLALEGWFEKPKNKLFGHVRVKVIFVLCMSVKGSLDSDGQQFTVIYLCVVYASQRLTQHKNK
jgi:hypothetical protein